MERPMKAYLATTGMIFALLAVAHLLRTVAEWPRVTTDPGFLLEVPGIGVVAGALCFWAWRLWRAHLLTARAGGQ
jgi:hypothetical protein